MPRQLRIEYRGAIHPVHFYVCNRAGGTGNLVFVMPMELQTIRAQESIRLGAQGRFDLDASNAVLAQLASACCKPTRCSICGRCSRGRSRYFRQTTW